MLFSYLSSYNQHLGLIPSFNLPVGITCPGMSEWCKKNCYSRKGRFTTRTVKRHTLKCYNLSKSKDFVREICKELRFVHSYVRVHVTGDFYSRSYIKAWREIARRNRRITFLAYTRAWRVPELLEELRELAKERNFIVYASTDETTGEPPEDFLEAGIERCYRKPFKVCQKQRMICSSCLYCFKGAGNVAFRY